MNPTDAIRRFYVVEMRDQGRNGRDRCEVRDRTGFLPPAVFEISPMGGRAGLARDRAITIATARNQCELAGEHIFEMGEEEGCQRCDASVKPEVDYQSGYHS